MIIQKIASDTGLQAVYLRRITKTASHRYMSYSIRKRTTGMRPIDHPAAELKLLQSWLARNILNLLPVHEAVFSYRKGTNIRDLAKFHQKKNYLLRVDFRDFFPSITGADVVQLLRKNFALFSFPLSRHDQEIVRSIVCKDDHLTIGAPSSPVISNALMFNFDSSWFNRSQEQKVVYSRYADDLFFSTNKSNTLEAILRELRTDLKQRKHPHLTVNDQKTVFTSRKRRRLVTGLVLTSDKKISISRHKKRLIRSMVCRFANGQLDGEESAYLRGYLAFVKSVEPSYLKRLRKKYGARVINDIKNSELVSRKPTH